MHKIVVLLVALSYLVFTSGFTINVHYCMGKVDSVSIGLGKTDVCNKCGMHTEDSKGCCKDETTVYKIDDNHQQVKYIYDYTPIFTVLANHYQHLFPYTIAVTTERVSFTDTSPPPLIKDRNVLFDCFRI